MALKITKGLKDWYFQKTSIERSMDSAAYQAAHPDDTLVLAGAARWNDVEDGGDDPNPELGTVPLLAMGMLQSVQFTSSKPTQPMMAIGSGRSFFVSGKSQTQWNIGRLFINGRNLLRVLYHNAVHLGIDIDKFDDPAALSKTSKFFINLDSELYYTPFGMGVVIRDKVHDWLGAFYVELMAINSYSLSINAGQNVILENVSGVADRMLPVALDDLAAKAPVVREKVDELVGITDAALGDTNQQTLAET